MMDKAGKNRVNSVERSNRVCSAVHAANMATVLRTVNALSALRLENVLVAVYAVNATEALCVTNVATADSGVHGERSLPSGALGEIDAADTPLRRSKVDLEGANATISNGMIFIIPDKKEVINVVDTCPPVLLFCVVDDLVGSNLICCGEREQRQGGLPVPQ